ncbi:LPD38 domain-containing protein [Alcaligenaceae bacterium B3P038]|nr:LPD38 domain-containing protein [Alcaligenaceae bacterium B3P038]
MRSSRSLQSDRTGDQCGQRGAVDLGAVCAIMERGTELAFAGDDYRLKDFGKTVASVLGDQLQMSPMPQMLKPYLEASFNYDSFRDRNIDTLSQERLPENDRYTSRTSAGAVALGKALGYSPQRIEHLVRGYFGWLGTQALSAADWAVRPALNMPANPSLWPRSRTGLSLAIS